MFGFHFRPPRFDTALLIVKEFELCYRRFSDYRRLRLPVVIICSRCGHTSQVIPINCLHATQPDDLTVVEGQCCHCCRRLIASLFFYVPVIVASDSETAFCYRVWSGLHLAIRVRCQCQQLSDEIFLYCDGPPGYYPVNTYCPTCGDFLNASVYLTASTIPRY